MVKQHDVRSKFHKKIIFENQCVIVLTYFTTKHRKCTVSQKFHLKPNFKLLQVFLYKHVKFLVLLDKVSQFYALKCIFVTIMEIRKCHTIFECVHL